MTVDNNFNPEFFRQGGFNRWNQNVTINLELPASIAILIASVIGAYGKDDQNSLELFQDVLTKEGRDTFVNVANSIISQSSNGIKKIESN